MCTLTILYICLHNIHDFVCDQYYTYISITLHMECNRLDKYVTYIYIYHIASVAYSRNRLHHRISESYYFIYLLKYT